MHLVICHIMRKIFVVKAVPTNKHGAVAHVVGEVKSTCAEDDALVMRDFLLGGCGSETIRISVLVLVVLETRP